MKKTILTLLIFLLTQPAFSTETGVFANDNSQQIFNTNLNNEVVNALTFESLSKVVTNINKNSTSLLEGFQRATDRYTQTNVIAAYKDFSAIINSSNEKNDFLYLSLAQRLDDIGFFTLSQSAIINIQDTELWYKPVSALKNMYNPAVTLTYDEEIYLAQLHTATLYNNSAKETIKTLSDNDKLLKKSDYANYVLAVAYFENKNYSKSLNYINKAINKAPSCLNYYRFKEKIYTQTGNYKAALKLINEVGKNSKISNYQREVLNNDKLFVMMKSSQKDKAKVYSAKWLYQTGEYQKALKEALAAILINKKNWEAFVLVGDCYLKNNESERAKEYYTKALTIKPKTATALLGLGHYYFLKNDYNKAVEYYQNAYKYSSQNETIVISLANSLLAIDDTKNATLYLNKALKINQNSDSAYYLLSKITPNMKEQYLRTAISLNPANAHAWLDLAELQIEQKNYKSAKEYLFPLTLINPDNPKYLYLKKIVENQGSNNFKSSYNEYFKEDFSIMY